MTTTRLIRRSAAMIAGAGVVAALALIPEAGANAKIEASIGAEAESDVSWTGTGAGSCTLTSGDDEVSSAMKTLTKAGTVHRTAAINAQYTNTASSSDTVRVKGSYTSTTVVKKHNNDLASVFLTGNGKLTVSHSLFTGSQCDASGEAFGAAEVAFTEHKAGHLVLTRANVKPALSIAVVENLKTGKTLVFDLYEGNNSSFVSKVAIKPGTYALEAESGLVTGTGGIPLKSASPNRTTKLKSGLSFVFVPKKK